MGACHCGRPILAKGLCGSHYRAQYRKDGRDRAVNEKRARAAARQAERQARKNEAFIHKRQKARGYPRFFFQMFSSLPGRSTGSWSEFAEKLGGHSKPCRNCGAPPSWGVCPICAREVGFVEPAVPDVEPIIIEALPHNDLRAERRAA